MAGRKWYGSVLSVLAFLFLGVVDGANGAAILTGDLRRATVSVGVPSDSDTDTITPPAPFAPFIGSNQVNAVQPSAQAVATANQTSVVSPILFSGTASSAVSVTVEDPFAFAVAVAESVFLITFELLSSHSFVLTGALTESQSGFAHLTVGSLEIMGTGAFSTTGILDPGSYAFEAAAELVESVGRPPGYEGPTTSGTVEQIAGFQFEFVLTDLQSTGVPEPSALVFIVSAAAGLVRFGHSRKARRRNS